MDLSNVNEPNQEGTIRIRDPKGLLWTVIGAIIFFAFSLFINVNIVLNPKLEDLPILALCFVIFNLPLLIILYRLRTIWNGIELDIENRRMSFQGGGIAANDFADYFKLSYLLQYFKRFDINIDDISQISTDNKVSLGWSKELKTYIETWTYTIHFVGTFGSASVKFSNEGKRDQIYNYIRQLNQMGTPYVKAN